MTSQGSPYTRFRRALEGGNLLIIRATAAELPRLGVAEAAAILLVIEQAQPDSDSGRRQRRGPRGSVAWHGTR
jgi:hypothetical protein